MKPLVYEQHDKAFKNVQAFVILKDGKRVATIAFKFPIDGAGRLNAFTHWFGTEMVRSWASGYGYDKKSAAMEGCMNNITAPENGSDNGFVKFVAVLSRINGSTWDRVLTEAGFEVLQAV